MSSLPERAKQLIDAPNFATLGTVGPDGTPHLSVHWVTRDGDDILLSTVVGRKKERDLRKNPRVSVSMFDPENPYSYFEVRGTATIVEEGARDLIDDLCEKYRGVRPYTWDAPDAVRIVIRVPPEHVATMGM